jgi:hypothetical protein
VSALGRAARWLVSVEPVPDHVYETWACPVCGRDVEVETVPTYMRMHGGWLPPGQHELVALCAVQHGVHRRDGSPPRELEPADPLAHWQLCVRSGSDGDVLVLDPAMPAVLVLAPSGDVYEAYAIDGGVAASDLVGPFSGLVRARGRFLGVVLAGGVRFSSDEGREDLVDCPTLRAWQRSLVSTSTSSPSGWTARGSAAGPSSRPS